MIDAEHDRRVLTASVLLDYVEAAVEALHAAGCTDRAEVRRLLADPGSALLKTARAVAVLDDPAMVERAIAQAVEIVLALD